MLEVHHHGRTELGAHRAGSLQGPPLEGGERPVADPDLHQAGTAVVAGRLVATRVAVVHEPVDELGTERVGELLGAHRGEVGPAG